MSHLPDVGGPADVWVDRADIEGPGRVEQGHVLKQHGCCLLQLALRDTPSQVIRPLGCYALAVHISEGAGDLICASTSRVIEPPAIACLTEAAACVPGSSVDCSSHNNEWPLSLHQNSCL